LGLLTILQVLSSNEAAEATCAVISARDSRIVSRHVSLLKGKRFICSSRLDVLRFTSV
jgi:hypothetical protein